MGENQSKDTDTTDYKRAYEAAMEALRVAQEALAEAERYKRSFRSWPWMEGPQPHCCPVCNGSGKTHAEHALFPKTTVPVENPCHACGGRGIVWSQP